MTDSILDKWLAILSKFDSHPDLTLWLRNHHNLFGDTSPLTYNKLGMHFMFQCMVCFSKTLIGCKEFTNLDHKEQIQCLQKFDAACLSQLTANNNIEKIILSNCMFSLLNLLLLCSTHIEHY